MRFNLMRKNFNESYLSVVPIIIDTIHKRLSSLAYIVLIFNNSESPRVNFDIKF